ncbi:MAG: type II toxin-antitoxin system VapC family toxin [Treponemataceae bacterium]|nr:MAG: type II toxin-antitoxin system VapC family toxin [Treponemataceae bacterium]
MDRFVFDTNTIIDFTDGKIFTLPSGKRFISVITEMELFAYPELTPKKEQNISDFLSNITIYPLFTNVKNEAIRIRRFGVPHLKLPDAIVAATAVMLSATLVTRDEKMLKLKWPGLSTLNIA